MAQIYVNAPVAPRGAITIHRAISAVESLIADFDTWNARRRTARELARLSSRQLADIGLSEAGIDQAAAHPRR